MKFPQAHTLKQIATIINASFVGPSDFPVLGMNEIHVVQPGDIVFVDHPKYYDKALNSAATIVLINKEVEAPEGKALLISDDPFRDFNKLTEYFKPFQKATSMIADSAVIGENSIVQPGAFIGNNVVIGDNCIIHSNVSIYDNCIIGNNVIIHSGSVLGADAFYYKKREWGYDKLKSGGRVIIEDDVEIGALCSIDKGVTGDTTIKKGSKFDNMVHIGHDTVMGERTLIAGQAGIAGCVVSGNDVTLWGQSGLTSGITVGDNTVLLAKSALIKSVPGNTTYFGAPADEARKKYKELASIRMLPGLISKIKE